MLSFRITHEEAGGAARVGVLTTGRSEVATPAFMPVGSLGNVRSVDGEELLKMGYGLILNNAYHLYLRPGHKVVEELGGVHGFTAWPGAILTDSGGFQVFSLGAMRKIKEELYVILEQHSGQPMDKIVRDADRDYWMRAQEAKEYGMIDEVLVRNKGSKEKISRERKVRGDNNKVFWIKSELTSRHFRCRRDESILQDL